MSISSVVNSISTAYLIARTGWKVYSTKTILPDVETPANAYRPRWPPIFKKSNQSDFYTDDAYLRSLMPNISGKVQVAVSQTGSLTLGSEDKVVGYFFDAFLRENHNSSLRITEHPVQGGANITDHAYVLPDNLSIEVFVSDAMDSVVTKQFSDYATKSVSAYLVLKALQKSRQPLSIKTKYGVYDNMLIQSLSAPVDYKTDKSMRCTLQLRQIIMAQAATEVASVLPQVTDVTNKGVVATLPDDASLLRKLTRSRGF